MADELSETGPGAPSDPPDREPPTTPVAPVSPPAAAAGTPSPPTTPVTAPAAPDAPPTTPVAPVAPAASWAVSPEGTVTPPAPPEPWPPATAPQPVVGAPWPPPQAAALPYPPGGGPPAGGSSSGPRRARGWILVAVVAALIGAGVGAGVTAATDNGNNSGVTVEEGTATPGAATLSGNVSIPQLVKKVLPAVVSIDVKSSTEEDEGTGMIISSTGEVVTNNHVIALADETGASITVTESGTTKKDAAKLVGADPTNDVALLQIQGASGLPTITFGDSNKLLVGDAVVAIGNALGLAAGTPTVTQGIVSALGRTVTAGDSGSVATERLTNMIQTDAAINPGNSGGPLIDTAGQVVGMNTAVAGSTGDGTDAQNIGFAIPAANVESLLPQLQKGGTVANGGGVLGVDVTTLTTQLRQQYGFTPTSGAVILSVVSGSPADTAKLREGDVITAIGSTSVTSAQSLQTAVSKHKAGDTIQVTYYVGDLKQTATVTLESQQSEQQQQSKSGTGETGGGTTGGGTSGTTTTAGSGASPFGGL
jgi:S1-C subfamily serine protease